MNRITTLWITLLLMAFAFEPAAGQDRYELNSEWKCRPSADTKDTGEQISSPDYSLKDWKPAIVPGTVLTTQLANGEIPDPFYGMNNEQIPDIHDTGREHYTYWFAKEFEEPPPTGEEQIWLTFRGINYSCDIYLNGKKVNKAPFKGMFLRKTFNITALLSPDGKNKLAVIVHPPDHVGKPNGGQGGDGEIARNLTHQYVAGWDWIQPIRDRNTGIWDKVFIERTGPVNILHPHVKTYVTGKRNPAEENGGADLDLSVELQNTTARKVTGTLLYTIDGITASRKTTLEPSSLTQLHFPRKNIPKARLWWPAGYGPQNLYPLTIRFIEDGSNTPSDEEALQIGFRQIDTKWNETTRSKHIFVNGQPIFIKGGNWIISDSMLRFSRERYDAEIRYHRDMNLNLIRIWGGAITERPEFYEACDKYGLLVIQDFWFSGDCNGRWKDAAKKEDQWTRRQYPDDHALFKEAAEDMVKMIRNHPSLFAWCGGNEITPPADLLAALQDDILPRHDGTRWFIEYSNADDMSYNFIGENGDGPYTIQPMESFWEKQTWPFNSEVGSVGVGDYESLARFLPQESLNTLPVYNPNTKFREEAHPVWTYHTYTGVGYENHLLPYGSPKDIRDFAMKAQLVNYDQYRALIEGFTSHMWSWYTGTIIWKTQNPWTAMRGQMYDYYLDPNACLFGTRKGGQMIHGMCNPVTKMVYLVNHSFEPVRDVMLACHYYDAAGRYVHTTQLFCYANAGDAKKIMSIKGRLSQQSKEDGSFLLIELRDARKNLISDNFYWYPNEKGEYSGLQKLAPAVPEVSARIIEPGKMEVTLKNSKDNVLAFFNRISLEDAKTGKRILPAFYSDNYISLVPGAEKKITIEYPSKTGSSLHVTIQGWNVKKQTITPSSP